VGQNSHEEITLAPRGANLGWPICEGTACVNQHRYEQTLPASECAPEGFLPPLLALPRSESRSWQSWSRKARTGISGNAGSAFGAPVQSGTTSGSIVFTRPWG